MTHSYSGEYSKMVEDCEARESRLTDWERRFISSIGEQLENERPLSEKQVESLERIWDRVTEFPT